MITDVHTKLLTSDEFWDRYGDQEEFADGLRLHYELINGEAVDDPMPMPIHGRLQKRLIRWIDTFLDDHPLGEVFGEVHCKVSRKDTFVPDVLYVSAARLAPLNLNKPFPLAPDLAIEIISPDNRADQTQEKIDAYLANGTQQGWVVYPASEEVIVHYTDRTARTFIIGEVLTPQDLLPGLIIPVADLFALPTPFSGDQA